LTNKIILLDFSDPCQKKAQNPTVKKRETNSPIQEKIKNGSPLHKNMQSLKAYLGLKMHAHTDDLFTARQ
jgi:hypothetical protein